MFSSGMDLASLGDLAANPGNLRAFRRACLDAWNVAEEMTKPTICVIHGACIGGAMELALACDLRVMAKDAVIGMPETRIGLIPDVGGSSRLPQVVGLGRAKEMVMTGKMINGDEAERIGLVNRVATIDKLGPETQKLIDELLACAPVAVGLAKRVMDASARPGAGDDARARGRHAGAVRALGGLRRGRQGLPGEAPARVQRPLTRPRTSPRSAPRRTTSSPSSRNVRVEPSASSIGSSPFQLSSMKAAALVSSPGPRSCPRRAGRRSATTAPLTVRWAICWAALQYRWRALVRDDDLAVELDLERDVERPRLLAQVGQRLGLLRRAGDARASAASGTTQWPIEVANDLPRNGPSGGTPRPGCRARSSR